MEEKHILYIGRFDSRCGDCGRGARPYEETHETVLGYAANLPAPGCGVKWTHVMAEYLGMDDLVAKMRPDLIPIPIDEWIKEATP